MQIGELSFLFFILSSPFFIYKEEDNATCTVRFRIVKNNQETRGEEVDSILK